MMTHCMSFEGGAVHSQNQVEQLRHQQTIHRAFSVNPDATEAAREIHRSLPDPNPAVIIFFCCVEYDLPALSEALAALFDKIPVVGCTTAGEISPAGYVQNSITAFSLPAELFQVETRLVNNLQSFSTDSANRLVEGMLRELQKHEVAPVSSNSFALTLLDGMSIREEMVMNSLSSALKHIQLVGGSAGDNLHFRDTRVYFNRQFHGNAAVLMLVNTRCPFRIFSDHHLAQGQEKLVVTEADPFKRIVHEFNAEPAALEYCRITGLSLEDLDSRAFALHPLAVQLGDEVYVRSIQQVN